MNNYQRYARELANVICNLMNLMYKEKASTEFKEELISSLQEIKHKKGSWVIER